MHIATENELLAEVVHHLPDAKKVLVFAPHPDDEVFGCGGALAQLHTAGVPVVVHVLTDGCLGGDNLDGQLAQRRAQESRNALETLGITDVVFWELPDRGLVYGELLIERLFSILHKEEADLVFLPASTELHPDHQTLSLVGSEALRRSGEVKNVVFYEISAPLPNPNLLLDISAEEDVKLQAMECYHSQLEQQPYAEQIQGLNRFRAYHLGGRCKSAEAYNIHPVSVKSVEPPQFLEKSPFYRCKQGDKAVNVNSPLVSIVVRSMDVSTLGEALDSLALQTYPNIEVVVVNAKGGKHSTLGTICGPFTLRLINQEGKALPRARAANTGMAACCGRYIGFLDDDDLVAPDHLKHLVGVLQENQDKVVAYTGAQGLDRGDPERKVLATFAEPNVCFPMLIMGNVVPIHTVLFPAKALESGILMDETLERYEDWDFWLQLLRLLPFKFVDKVTATYYSNGKSNVFPFDPDCEIVSMAMEAMDIKWSKLLEPAELREISNFYTQKQSDATACLNDIESQLKESESLLSQANEHLHIVDSRSTAAATNAQAQIDSLNEAISKQDKELFRFQQVVTDRDEQICELTSETVRRGEWALRLKSELQNERSQYLNLTKSNSWRFTLPLREARRWVNAPRVQVKRYTKTVLNWAKRSYQSLPLNYQTKAFHRNTMAKYFPRVLLASGSPPITIARLNLSKFKESLPVAKQSLLDLNDQLIVEMQTSSNPKISIVIPVYGEINYTLRCLRSISLNSPQVAYEIIVVDDCSPDNSEEVLTNIKGIRLLKNLQNQGFIRSCNLGTKESRGDYLCFLNNDTEVTAGWLDELLRTFHEFPGTGLVGSKLVYPDGKLQEAGGIIWQDGSAWNFGRFQDPQLPIYNYAREVDYCSGASIMVPRELFEELGGFDEHYLPAYCEDSDLALKIRDMGYRVIYQPLSTVIHHEGVTSGTDTSQGVKSYQVKNSKKMFERWKTHLQTHQEPGVDVDSAKDRRATRRVLVIDHCTPTPDQDSGSIDSYNIMLLLREMDFQVTFIPEDNFLYVPQYTADLQRVGIEVLYAPYITSIEQHLKGCDDRYDLAFLFRPVVAERHMDAIRRLCPKAKVLFHTVDLHFLRMAREAELATDRSMRMAAEEMKKREISLMVSADISTVLSTLEFELLSQYVPEGKVKLLPYSRSIEGTDNTFSERRDIVFVGGYQHTPNIDAVQYFVTKIMPILRRRLPGVKFYVVGSNPPPEIKSLESEDVVVTGFVEDLNPLLDKMRLSVAPLRYGAGIKGKIGSAMAVGLPVVATPLAAEGMGLADEDNILIAEEVDEFATAIFRLYQDESLWNRLSSNSLDFAEKAWGAEAAWRTLNAVLSDISIGTIRSDFPLSLFSDVDVIRKANKAQLMELTPIASIQNRAEFEIVLESDPLKKIRNFEKTLLDTSTTEEFSVNGYCVPCNKKVSFKVDMLSGGQRREDSWIPNWRERLECPLCGMSNRQRLIATLVAQILQETERKKVYIMEQVTPIYGWMNTTFNDHEIIGSEYLGYKYEGGSVIKGIRHEDVENLSFSDGELDLIVSNDVFEHVPNYAQAFSECARVLKSGGIMLATIPFHYNSDKSVIRAEIADGTVSMILPPSYHGNPVSVDGSLVFTDFGWDMLDEIKEAGFSNVTVNIYASEELGHLGGGQIIFEANR